MHLRGTLSQPAFPQPPAEAGQALIGRGERGGEALNYFFRKSIAYLRVESISPILDRILYYPVYYGQYMLLTEYELFFRIFLILPDLS